MKRAPVSDAERARWQALAALLAPLWPAAPPAPPAGAAPPTVGTLPADLPHTTAAVPAAHGDEVHAADVVQAAAQAVFAAAAVHAAEDTLSEQPTMALPAAGSPSAPRVPGGLADMAALLRRAATPIDASPAAPVDPPDPQEAIGLFLGRVRWGGRSGGLGPPRPAAEVAPVMASELVTPTRSWFSTRVPWQGRRGAAPEPPLVAFMALATGQALTTASRRGADRPVAAARFFRSVSWNRRAVEPASPSRKGSSSR